MLTKKTNGFLSHGTTPNNSLAWNWHVYTFPLMDNLGTDAVAIYYGYYRSASIISLITERHDLFPQPWAPLLNNVRRLRITRYFEYYDLADPESSKPCGLRALADSNSLDS